MSAKIYTKTGDRGETGLFAGARVPKDDARIEAYGTVDELNAVLGLIRAQQPTPELDRLLTTIQHELFSLGAELATPEPNKHGTQLIGPSQTAALEAAIDQSEARLAPLTQFILPGGGRVAALLHVARTVCRRAERRVVTLSRQAGAPVSQHVVIYLNRLSDLLFVLARRANAEAGQGDLPWVSPRS